jgi:hypothetical protein
MPKRAAPRWRSWPRACLILVAGGVAILALPGRLEGPPIVEVGVGHAVSALDLLGIIPLALGSAWLHSGLWTRRERVKGWIRESPDRAIAVFGTGSLGLGLLLASALSSFFWWWAIGAALFVVMHVPVVMAAARRSGRGR